MDYIKSASDIISLLGGKKNISNYSSCMTRLRVSLKDTDNAHISELKNIEGVLGVNENGNDVQLIFGPGKVQKALEAFETVFYREDKYEQEFEEIIKKEKAAIKKLRSSRFQEFMSKFSNIFVPLIPGFIAAGTLAGLGGLLKELGVSAEILNYIGVFNRSLTRFMYVIIGYNAATAFGGAGILGGILSGLFLLTYGENPTSGMNNFLGIFIDPRGGMIGILITAIIGAKVENFIRKKFSWEATDIITTPILTLLITSIFAFIVIMPISFKLFGVMNWAFINLNGNPIGSGLLAGLFLPSVMMGIHQGFVPVYQGLVESTGMNSLFPILAMAGAGQVGAALALYVKAPKESKLRKNIRGAIIPGLLGIGEPLIYGVTLPRVKPFLTSMLGGMVGGVYIGTLANLGFSFGLNTVFGSSGLLAAFAMTSKRGIVLAIALYLSSLLVSYAAGFIITYLFGTRDIDLS